MAEEYSGPSEFGIQLRRLRIAARLTQEMLAERSGISVDAIGTLESGRRRRPHPQTVRLLADGLRLDAHERECLVLAARASERRLRAIRAGLVEEQAFVASVPANAPPPHAPLPPGSLVPLAPNPPSVVAAVLAAMGPLAGWLPTKSAAQGMIDERLERLATVVRVQWEREANVRQLHDPQPIAVRWRAADPRLMDHAEVIAGGRTARGGPVRAGTLEEVVEEFVRLPRRRLVVLGEPGAGKSGIMLLLTLGLLARRTPADPVPVLLSVASWDPSRTGFQQWLARHLSDEYPFVRPAQAQAIVVEGRVLPLLDGLDELPDRAAAAAVAMINGAGLKRPLVVASRTTEFSQAVHAGDVLTGAAVVELEPVRPEQAETYLRLTTPPDDRLARWEPVFAELRLGPSRPVAGALSTPLMVTLARAVYALDRSADPAELLRYPSREAIEHRLLDALIPALYAGSSRWSAHRAQTWLAFLAAQMRRRGTRDLAWWELASGRALSQMVRAAGLGLAVGFLAALRLLLVPPEVPPGVTLDPTAYLLNVFLNGIIAGISAAIVAGVGAAIAVGLSLVGLAALRRPARLVLRFDRSFLRRLLTGAMAGVLAALPLVLAAALLGMAASPEMVGSPLSSAAVGLLLALPLAVGFGLVFGLLRPSEQPPTPASSLASNRLMSIITLLVASLSLPLLLAAGSQSLSDLLVVVALGLRLSMPIALGMAAVLPWTAYQLAYLRLALRGRLPWRLLAFLEDAHQRGLLRQVGGVYQFRHASLQDRLAAP